MACYAAQLHAQLTALIPAYDPQAVSLAAVIVRVRHDLLQHRRSWQHREHSQHLIGAYQHLRQRLGDQAESLVHQVQVLWQRRHRASSAIEGFNAALQLYLYVHKGVTPGFLALFQAYFNLRQRRWGPRRGTSAYQQITGQPVSDWLTMLGFPPTPTIR